MELKLLKPGDFLIYWQPTTDRETGRPAEELCYARVLRTGPKRVRVIDRERVESWQYPERFFARLDDDETITDLLANDFAENVI